MNKEDIRKRLESHKAIRIENPSLTPSAVLITLFEKGGQWHVLLTLRPPDIASHQNQICFPGGRADEGEKALEAALREAEEEMGIKPEDVEILGRLDDILTITYYRISPFVGVIPYPYPFKVSEKEIAEVIEIPLADFADPKNFRRDDNWQFQGHYYPVYFFNIGRHVVWGATAKIMKQFLELVLDWKEP